MLLWSLIPSEPLFAPSRRAAEVARRRAKAIPGESARSPPAPANELVKANKELREILRLLTLEQIVYIPLAVPI